MSRSPSSTTGTALIRCSIRVAATSLSWVSGPTVTTGRLITSPVRMSSSSGRLGVSCRDEVGGVDVVAAALAADQAEGVVGEVVGVGSAAWAGGHGLSFDGGAAAPVSGRASTPGGGRLYGRRSRRYRAVWSAVGAGSSLVAWPGLTSARLDQDMRVRM